MAAGTVNEGTLKGDLPKIPVHIFVEERALWHVSADDGGPRYARHEPGFQDKIDRNEGFPGAEVINRSWDPILPKGSASFAADSSLVSKLTLLVRYFRNSLFRV